MKKEKKFKGEKIKKDMSLLGNGRGFLGLSRRYNLLINSLSILLGIVGITYFVYIEQILPALGILGLLILILVETNS